MTQRIEEMPQKKVTKIDLAFFDTWQLCSVYYFLHIFLFVNIDKGVTEGKKENMGIKG